MSALVRYLSPVWGWVLLWWLVFNGALYAFINGMAGGILQSSFAQLWERLAPWKEMIGWI